MSRNKGEDTYPRNWHFGLASCTCGDNRNLKFFTILTVVIAIAALAFTFGLLEVPNPVGASESQTSMGQCCLRNRSEFEQPVYAAEDQAKPNDFMDSLDGIK